MIEYLNLLTFIASKEGLYASLKTSSLLMSKELDIPQQTLSRKLKDMEDKGLIERQSSTKGMVITLTDKSRQFLQTTYRDLGELFKAKKTVIQGTVKSGIGEGAYYMAQVGYQEQFKDKLGYKPFQGTLNLDVDVDEVVKLMANKEKITINEFKTKERTFGGLSAYRIRIGKIDGAIITPDRTRHSADVIEVIASVNLRNALSIKNGDKVKLQ